MRELFLHIGYPKTATTTLQSDLFPRHEEIAYLRDVENWPPFMTDVLYARENHIKRHRSEYHDQVAELAERTEQARPGLSTHVYSEESILSFSMFFRFEPWPYVWTLDPASTARKLHAVFGEARTYDAVKVLITVRRQEELITSMYGQVYNFVFKKFKPTRSFTAFYNYAFGEGRNGFILDALAYAEVIDLYAGLFGRENVKVLVFEQLRESPDRFVTDLCGYLGIDAAKGAALVAGQEKNVRRMENGFRTDERSLWELLAQRKHRLLGPTRLGLADSWLGRKLRGIYVPGRVARDIRLDEVQRRQVREHFAEGNRRMAAEWSLDLERYGYY